MNKRLISVVLGATPDVMAWNGVIYTRAALAQVAELLSDGPRAVTTQLLDDGGGRVPDELLVGATVPDSVAVDEAGRVHLAVELYLDEPCRGADFGLRLRHDSVVSAVLLPYTVLGAGDLSGHTVHRVAAVPYLLPWSKAAAPRDP